MQFTTLLFLAASASAAALPRQISSASGALSTAAATLPAGVTNSKPCSQPGAIVCSSDGSQFAICDGTKALFQAVASGTACQGDSIVGTGAFAPGAGAGNSTGPAGAVSSAIGAATTATPTVAVSAAKTSAVTSATAPATGTTDDDDDDTEGDDDTEEEE